MERAWKGLILVINISRKSRFSLKDWLATTNVTSFLFFFLEIEFLLYPCHSVFDAFSCMNPLRWSTGSYACSNSIAYSRDKVPSTPWQLREREGGMTTSANERKTLSAKLRRTTAMTTCQFRQKFSWSSAISSPKSFRSWTLRQYWNSLGQCRS